MGTTTTAIMTTIMTTTTTTTVTAGAAPRSASRDEFTDPMGRPLAGITIVLAGSSEGRVQTDGDGRYMFSGLAPGSYAVRPTEPRCGFGPDVMNLNNLGASTVQNFTANCR